MERFGSILRLVLCFSVLAVVLSVPTSSQAVDPGPPGGLDVSVVNPLPLPVTGTVSGSVSITGTPNVNVTNTSSNPVPTADVSRPSKASQLVTVMATHSFCGFGGIAGNRTFATTQNADGTTSQFTVPSGQVFIITEVELFANSGTAGHVVQLQLGLISGLFESVVIWHQKTLDASGAASATFTLPTGASVKSGVTLCAAAVDVNTGGFVFEAGLLHGFYAPDN